MKKQLTSSFFYEENDEIGSVPVFRNFNRFSLNRIKRNGTSPYIVGKQNTVDSASMFVFNIAKNLELPNSDDLHFHWSMQDVTASVGDYVLEWTDRISGSTTNSWNLTPPPLIEEFEQTKLKYVSCVDNAVVKCSKDDPFFEDLQEFTLYALVEMGPTDDGALAEFIFFQRDPYVTRDFFGFRYHEDTKGFTTMNRTANAPSSDYTNLWSYTRFNEAGANIAQTSSNWVLLSLSGESEEGYETFYVKGEFFVNNERDNQPYEFTLPRGDTVDVCNKLFIGYGLRNTNIAEIFAYNKKHTLDEMDQVLNALNDYYELGIESRASYLYNGDNAFYVANADQPSINNFYSVSSGSCFAEYADYTESDRYYLAVDGPFCLRLTTTTDVTGFAVRATRFSNYYQEGRKECTWVLTGKYRCSSIILRPYLYANTDGTDAVYNDTPSTVWKEFSFEFGNGNSSVDYLYLGSKMAIGQTGIPSGTYIEYAELKLDREVV